MRRLSSLALVSMLTFVVVTTVQARAVIIESSASLSDHSESAVTSALVEAVQAAIQGAAAMGLTRIVLRQALVLEDGVLVQIAATDAATDEDEEVDADEIRLQTGI